MKGLEPPAARTDRLTAADVAWLRAEINRLNEEDHRADLDGGREQSDRAGRRFGTKRADRRSRDRPDRITANDRPTAREWPRCANSRSVGDTGGVAQQRSTFAKLQREREKKEKAAAKADRRAQQAAVVVETAAPKLDPAEETKILAELAELHAALEDGAISIEDFEDRRDQLRKRLQIN